MSKVKVGIQLIVFNNRERKDLAGVLKDCKETGLIFCYHNHSLNLRNLMASREYISWARRRIGTYHK